MTPYERVKLSRQRTAATFPLPSPLDCIRYAICEMAEYDDAMLRLERTGDERNNARTPDPRAELGQAIYMLLSAAVQWKTAPTAYQRPPQSRLHMYASALSWMVGFLVEGKFARAALPVTKRQRLALGMTTEGAYAVLCAIAAHHEWDVDALVDDTCAAFEAKHMAVTA